MYAQPGTLRSAEHPFADPRMPEFNSCGRSHSSFVLLLDRLALLPQHLFIGIADAFTFVGFRRIIRSNVGSDLTYFLAINPFNQNLSVLLDGDFNAVRNLKYDRVGKAQTEVQFCPLQLGTEPDSLNLQRFLKSLANPGHHIVDETSGKTVQRFHRAGFSGPVQHDLFTFDAKLDLPRQGPLQLTFRPFNSDCT